VKLYDEGAQWYDLMSTGTPGDAKFYVKEARKTKGKVLEVACGSGRIYLELLKAGVDAHGFDLSSGMLRILNGKAKKRGLKTKVKKADMRSFSYPFKFDLIIVPYRAFLHMETREDQKKCLRAIHKHMKKGGRLILNFFDPKTSIISKEHVKWKDEIKKVGDRKARVMAFSDYDLVNQRIHSHWKMVNPQEGMPKSRLEITLTYIFPREFMNMLELCGFSKWKLYGGFDYKPYIKHGQELVWIAYK
jgi:ubiquinone/menaquinone biosynthesis C-methylase UbiE